MPNQKSDIIKQLEAEILPLQGYKATFGKYSVGVDLGPINKAFPDEIFPLGAVHEFVTPFSYQAATAGFIAAILPSLMSNNGVVLWISDARTIFPPALKHFNIEPHRVIFIDLKNDKEVIWAVNEALQLNSLAAVVGEMKDINFMASRRFQLAVEQSGVTGFLFNKKSTIHSTACLTRWRISSLPGKVIDDLPGVGFPAWKVELLKVRNGRPGSWDIAYINGRFITLNKQPKAISDLQIKTA